MILNLYNNKFYIGSSKNVFKRMGEHKSQLDNNKHPNRHLHFAHSKYGKKYFIYLLIEKVDDINNLFIREQHWMDELNATNQDIGYNLSPTAGSSLGIKHSNEIRRHFSEIRKGKNLGWHHTDEAKKKMRLSNSQPSKDALYKLSEERKKPVIQLDKKLNFIARFDSIVEASEKTNTHRGHISDCCKYNLRTTNGFVWVHELDYLDLSYIDKLHKECPLVKICQYDFEGNLIKTWDSIVEAAKFYNINRSGISNCCANRIKTSYGFIWKYYNEVFPEAINA